MKRILSFILAIGILLSSILTSSALAMQETLVLEEDIDNQENSKDEEKNFDLSEDIYNHLDSDEEEISVDEELMLLDEEDIIEKSLDGYINSEPSGIIEQGVSPESNFYDFTKSNLSRSLNNYGSPSFLNNSYNPGEVRLFKEAKAVEGKVNTWEITLRVEGRNKPTTSDIILVVDRSGSMANPESRMKEAKKAAKKFAEQLLLCEHCRMGLVSFASSSRLDQSLTRSYRDLNYKINQLVADGGTFTQAAIRQARDMLNQSTADNKHIVVVSDGEPTYSYELKNPNKYATNDVYNVKVSYGRQGKVFTATRGQETVPQLNEIDFNYPKEVGEGTAMRHIYNYNDMFSRYKMYNHGNSAIAEANFAGADGYNLFTIGLQTNTDGDRVLNEMKQGIGTFTKVEDPSQLTPILEHIAGEIESAVKNAKIIDPMGLGFEISEEKISKITTSQGEAIYKNNTIEWTPGTLTEPIEGSSDINYAELKYTVEINEDIINAESINNLYPTNGEATIEYTDVSNEKKKEKFPVPTVKPLLYSVNKEVQDKDGKAIQKDKDFEISVTGPEDYKKIVNLNTNINSSSGKITDIREPGKYRIEESSDTRDYEVTYFINGQETNEFNIEDNNSEDLYIKVVNKEKPGKITISKEIEENDLLETPDFEFKISGPDNYEEIIKLPDNGLWEKEINNLKRGKYTITELDENYKTSIKVNEEDFQEKKYADIYLEDGKIDHNIVFKNEYNRSNLQIQKRSSKDESKLENVEFTLYKSDDLWNLGNKIVEKLTDINGIARFDSLLPGKYILKETKSLDGFIVEANYWKVEVNMSGETIVTTNKDKPADSEIVNDHTTYIIYNTPRKPGFELPTTGGSGRGIFTIIGITLGATALIGLQKKKNEKSK